jgi:Holliday junction resolvase
MSHRNKIRGYEFEHEIVVWGRLLGFDCRRIFGSGAFKVQLGDEFAGDIVLEGLRIEAKRRKNGFKTIYDAFEQDDCDVVCVRADRKERLWIVKDDQFARFLK